MYSCVILYPDELSCVLKVVSVCLWAALTLSDCVASFLFFFTPCAFATAPLALAARNSCIARRPSPIGSLQRSRGPLYASPSADAVLGSAFSGLPQPPASRPAFVAARGWTCLAVPRGRLPWNALPFGVDTSREMKNALSVHALEANYKEHQDVVNHTHVGLSLFFHLFRFSESKRPEARCSVYI